ncbi:MAG: DNA repair protein RecO [Clostridiaceae bacterium]|nr:DNA repair protein RecO [Clostridiaceae bacterium]
MSYVKTRGMVVREIEVGDYDKLITVVTDDLGKISVSAKGTRRSGNRFSAGTQVFSYCEWVLYKGKNTYILNSCDIITSFYEIRKDLSLLAYSAHMLDILQDTTYENQPAKEPLTLLLYALNALSRQNREPELIVRVFSLKLVQIMGFAPSLNGCRLCGTKKIDDIYFSFDKCGFTCEECRKQTNDAVKIKLGAAKALIYVICAEIKDAFSFNLSSDALKDFSEVVDKYLDNCLGKRYQKLSFLKGIE